MTTMAQSTMNITINGTTKVCTLVSNSSTKALLEQLEKGAYIENGIKKIK